MLAVFGMGDVDKSLSPLPQTMPLQVGYPVFRDDHVHGFPHAQLVAVFLKAEQNIGFAVFIPAWQCNDGGSVCGSFRTPEKSMASPGPVITAPKSGKATLPSKSTFRPSYRATNWGLLAMNWELHTQSIPWNSTSGFRCSQQCSSLVPRA